MKDDTIEQAVGAHRQAMKKVSLFQTYACLLVAQPQKPLSSLGGSESSNLFEVADCSVAINEHPHRFPYTLHPHRRWGSGGAPAAVHATRGGWGTISHHLDIVFASGWMLKKSVPISDIGQYTGSTTIKAP